MHLLALLIATVFSSQFTEVNAIVGLAANPATLTATQLTGVFPNIALTITSSTSAITKWELCVDAAGSGAKIDITAKVSGTPTTGPFTFAPAGLDVSTLYAATMPASIYIIATNTEGSESVAIAITADFGVIPASITDYALSDGPTFTATQVSSSWTGGNKVFWAICEESTRTGPQLAAADVQGLFTVTNNGEAEIELTPKQIAKVLSFTGNKLYFYTGLADAATAATKKPVAVTLKTSAFTCDRKAVPLSKVAPAADFTFTLNTKAGVTWEKSAAMKIRVAGDEDGDDKEVDYNSITVDATTAGKITLPVLVANWAAFEVTAKGHQIYIFAQLNTVTSPITDSTPLRLTVVDDFEVHPKKAYGKADKIHQMKIIPTTGAWDTAKTIKVKFTNATLGDKTTAGFFESEVLTFADGAYTVPVLDLSEQTFTNNNFLVYVGVNTNAALFPYVFEPVQIPIAASEFSTTPVTITDAAETVAGTVTLANDVSASMSPNKIKLFIRREEVEDPTTLDPTEGVDVPFQTLATTYPFTAVEIPEGTGRLTIDDLLYVYVSYVKTAGTETVFLTHGRTIPVTEDTTKVRYELSKTSISVDDLPTHGPITITQTIGKAWPGTIKAQLTLQDKSEGTIPVSEPLTADEHGVYTMPWTQAIKDYLVGAAAGKKITIKVNIGSGSTYLNHGADIMIAPGRQCTINPASVTVAEWAAGKTFIVTITSSGAWPDTGAIFISKNPAHTHAITNDIKKTFAALPTDKKLTVAVTTAEVTAFGAINSPTTLYFFVSATGDAKLEQAPTELAIVANPAPLEFDVAPLTVKTGATSIPALTITPKTASLASWTSDDIIFKVSDVDPAAAYMSNTEVTGTATKGTGNVWTSDDPVVLSTLQLAVGKKLYIYASKTDQAPYLETPATITIEAATTPSFTATPLEMFWASSLKTPLITLVPTGITWPIAAATDFKAKFSYGTTSPTTVEIAIAVAGAAAPYTYTIPLDSDISALNIKEADLPATVKIDVKTAAATYMEAPVTFTIKKKASDAAMGVSPLVSLLAALVFLFVKLF